MFHQEKYSWKTFIPRFSVVFNALKLQTLQVNEQIHRSEQNFHCNATLCIEYTCIYNISLRLRLPHIRYYKPIASTRNTVDDFHLPNWFRCVNNVHTVRRMSKYMNIDKVIPQIYRNARFTTPCMGARFIDNLKVLYQHKYCTQTMQREGASNECEQSPEAYGIRYTSTGRKH